LKRTSDKKILQHSPTGISLTTFSVLVAWDTCLIERRSMKIVLDVIRPVAQAQAVRATRDWREDWPLAEGRMVMIQRPKGRFEAGFLQLKELDALPSLPLPVVRVSREQAPKKKSAGAGGTRLVIEVVTDPFEADALRAKRNPLKDWRVSRGRLVLIWDVHGRFRPTYLQFKEVRSLPAGSLPVIRATVA
jgi:hypothetical protein